MKTFGRYETLGDQFKDSRNAIKYLPSTVKSRLGQSPEDLGSKILAVTKAVEAGATALQNPKAPPTPPKEPDKTPFLFGALGVVGVLGVLFFLGSKK